MVLGVEEYDLSKEDSTGMKPLILFFFSPSDLPWFPTGQSSRKHRLQQTSWAESMVETND